MISSFFASYGDENFSEEMIEQTEGVLQGQRISLRQVEGSGLGYSVGYSSLDLFFQILRIFEFFPEFPQKMGILEVFYEKLPN